ncbi:MAG: nucleoside triphosphate pyrophosphohydrolase [Nitrospirales bacterium]
MTSPSIPSQPDPAPFGKLVEIMRTLRSVDGCPWDREQTHQSLKPYLLEECYEVLEALDAQDPASLKEELGDLLLQVLFHAQIASEHGQFDLGDICDTLAKKLIHRHPHVFQVDSANRNIQSASDVIRQWDQLKRQEQTTETEPPSHLKGIPKTAPALARAYQMQKRAARAGFDWHTIEPVLEKFREELQELSTAASQMIQPHQELSASPGPEQDEVEAELGDVLFSLVNLSRFLHLNPEEALRKATNRFQSRFMHVERQASHAGKDLQACSPEDMDSWWNSAKAEERTRSAEGHNLPDKEMST